MAQKTYRVELTNKELSYLLRLMPVWPSTLRKKLGQAYLSKRDTRTTPHPWDS